MKRTFAIIILAFVVITNTFSQLVNTEITEDFKKVVKTIAQENFKEFIYSKIKETNPMLASTTYDLIDNIVSGESISTIHESVINTIIDYGTMQLILENLKPDIDSIRSEIFYRESNKSVNDNDYNKILYLSVIYIYEALAYKNIQPIGDHITTLLYSEDQFFNTIYLKDDTNHIDIRNHVVFLMEMEGNPYSKIFKEAMIFKENASSIYRSRKIDSTTLLQPFPHLPKDYKSQLKRINDITINYIARIRASIDPANTKYTSIVEYCLPYFRSLFIKGDISNNISDKYFIKNLSKTIEKIFVDYESSISYEIGLWAGYFIQGPPWLPDSSKYPVLSLRINDRIQWAFVSCDSWKGFVFGGGLIDYALRELSKNGQNEFLSIGVGFSYKNISLTTSTGFPVNSPGEKKWAGIVALTYDLPLSQVVNALKN